MFVLSLKASTLKVTAALAALAIVIAAAFWEGGVARTLTDTAQGAAVSKPASATGVAKCPDLSTNMLRVAFLKSLGWQVDSEPAEVVEVIIPQTFNAVYNNYNAIQKAQGCDLTQYRGVRAKRWTYTVTNYPGAAEGVRANLLIYNNRLIGGDISSVSINGFMQGLAAGNVKTGIEPSQADIVAETFRTYNPAYSNSN
jgi:hypothetical protein